MEPWIREAMEQWHAENVRLNPPAQLSDIEALEKKLSFEFPESFKKLYLIVNGFHDFEWRTNLFSWWSLDRIAKEYEDDRDADFIGFSDFLIVSHVIGFDRTTSKIFKQYGFFGREQIDVSDFKDIIIAINSNSDFIY